jgi:hypothetical protein
MNDENENISITLLQLGHLVMQSDAETRERIAVAYLQAQEMVASIAKDHGDARPRIVACFECSTAFEVLDDIAWVEWMLTAVEERVNERDLRNWRSLRKVIKTVVKVLPLVKPTVH